MESTVCANLLPTNLWRIHITKLPELLLHKKTHKKPKIKSIFAWPQTVVTNKCKRPNRHPIKKYKQFVEIIQKTKDIGCLKMSPCM